MPTPAHRPPRRSGAFRGSERTKRSGTALTRVPDDYDEGAADHAKKPKSSKPDSAELPPADDVPPCQHPLEALQDLRYRQDDTLCPICHGRLPRMSHLHEKEDTFMSAPPVWKVAPRGESWAHVGLHHEDMPPACVRQRLDQQKLRPHDEGNAAAHFELGVKLAREASSRGRSPSAREALLSQAAGWFRAAAFLGHPKASYQIAMCCLEGRGTRKDAREGVAFLRKAATGDAEGAYELGQCYAVGLGVEQDADQAATWWRKALELGHLHAQSALNKSAAATTSASQQAKTAQLRRRADAGDPEAQYQVGVRLMDGVAMTRDEAQSARYYRLAAMQDHASAQCALALCYRHGAGVRADMGECLKWLNVAADSGHAIALAELAAMYEDGVGVEKDVERAKQLMQESELAEKVRVFEHCHHLALPRRGRLAVKAKDIEPHLSYLRARLAHLRTCLAATALAKALLGCLLRRRLRRSQQRLLQTDRHEWHRARARTIQLETHLQSLFKPLCVLMGHEPHVIPAEEAEFLLEDVDSMVKHLKGGHSFEHSRGSTWDRAAHQAHAASEGVMHGKVATLAEAAVHLYGEKQLEMEWEGDQVISKDGLKPLAFVDFTVRYDRTKGAMYAVSIASQLVGDAPLPGAILVLPRRAEPERELQAVDARKDGLERALRVMAAKQMTRVAEEDGGGFVELTPGEKAQRDLLAGRLERTSEEHALRKAEAGRHKSEWWQDLWSESRARPICDNDALLAAHLIVDEQYQQVRGQVTEIEDGDADAQLELGYMYLVGEGAPKSAERAVHWFERAARQGQVQAKCALGVCHAVGAGVGRESRAKAKELFEEAAAMGFALAHTYLADMHRYGTGLERPDHMLMLDHIRSAVLSCSVPSNTFNRAGNRLGEIYSHAGILPGSTKFSMESEKKLVPRNDAKAFDLFLDASKTPGLNSKFGRALNNLGEMYEYGRAPRSKREAESKDATERAKWREASENKALELYEEARGAQGAALCERALSNLRAMPAHLSDMAGTGHSWEEYVDDVEKRLTRVFTDDD